MLQARLVFDLSFLLYGVALSAALFGGRRLALVALPAAAGVVCGLAYIALRYWLSWPMTPMFMGTAAVPPLLAAFGLLSLRRHGDSPLVLRSLLAVTVLVAGLSVFFPKDFYLPFIKTTSAFSHLMLVFGALARACVLVGGAWAMAAFSREGASNNATKASFFWLVLGFAFWTLSLFSGEMWSYRGWGYAVVWEDPAIIAAMATWFYYVGLIHFHLLGGAGVRSRAVLTLAGVVLVLVLNCGADLGPFHSPVRP
jgi:hypothetical protein